MCFNKKVLAGVAVLAGGLLLVNPGWAIVALPLLLVAACPLSMIFMMRGMRSGQRNSCGTAGQSAQQAKPGAAQDAAQSADEIARLRAEVDQLRAAQGDRDRR